MPIPSSKGLLHGLEFIDKPMSKRKAYPPLAANRGVVVTHIATGIVGAVMEWTDAVVVLRDDAGRDHRVRSMPGGFLHEGANVTLSRPDPQREAALSASGSITTEPAPARLARGSRLWVEGTHDAELVEHVWGDDLRELGVVVEALHGADNLKERVASFAPTSTRRLGVLLDHYLPGTKEYRIGSEITHPDVLIAGHTAIDVWAAVRPQALGITEWPEVPRSEDWKQGVATRLGYADTRAMWHSVRRSVRSFRDLDASLVGSVERLIDFVTEFGE